MKHKPMKSIGFRKLLPNGSVLVFSLLILSIMLVTSLTILSSAVLDRKASLSTGSSTRSFQVADSGVEEVLYQIYKNAAAHDNLSDLATAVGGNCIAPGTITFPVAGGDAKVVFYQGETTVYAVACNTDDDWRDKVVKIKSEGTAGSTTRAVEVAVAAGNTKVLSGKLTPSDLTGTGCGGYYSKVVDLSSAGFTSTPKIIVSMADNGTGGSPSDRFIIDFANASPASVEICGGSSSTNSNTFDIKPTLFWMAVGN